MKIRLLTQQHVTAPAGTVIDVDDGRAALLIDIGAAVEVVDKATETCDSLPKRKTRKKSE